MTLVEHDAQLRALLPGLASEKLLGLDTETTLYSQELCLVQVATRAETFVIDALQVDLSMMAPLMSARSPLKVAHNASFERRALAQVGIQLQGTYDTLRASRALHAKPAGGHGLAAVVRRHLGRHLDKTEQCSDWSNRPLSRAQLDYAALDAELMPELYDALQRRLPNSLFG